MTIDTARRPNPRDLYGKMKQDSAEAYVKIYVSLSGFLSVNELVHPRGLWADESI